VASTTPDGLVADVASVCPSGLNSWLYDRRHRLPQRYGAVRAGEFPYPEHAVLAEGRQHMPAGLNARATALDALLSGNAANIRQGGCGNTWRPRQDHHDVQPQPTENR
jgi:hypothetical protein